MKPKTRSEEVLSLLVASELHMGLVRALDAYHGISESDAAVRPVAFETLICTLQAFLIPKAEPHRDGVPVRDSTRGLSSRSMSHRG